MNDLSSKTANSSIMLLPQPRLLELLPGKPVDEDAPVRMETDPVPSDQAPGAGVVGTGTPLRIDFNLANALGCARTVRWNK